MEKTKGKEQVDNTDCTGEELWPTGEEVETTTRPVVEEVETPPRAVKVPDTTTPMDSYPATAHTRDWEVKLCRTV